MTRVLYVCPNLAVGGAERHGSVLVRGLAERGFEVGVLTLYGAGPFFDLLTASGIDARCAWAHGRTDWKGLRRALALGLAFAPDVVVARSVSALAVGRLLAWRAGAPFVASEHGDYELRPLRRHQRAVMRLLAPAADAVIHVARAQSRSLTKLGYRPERMHVVRNGTPPLQPSRRRADTRRALGLAEEDFVALLVATLRPEKRAGDFVAAVVEANRTDGRIRGLVARDRPELDAVQAASSSTGGIVQTLGARSDVPDLLDASDVVCLTSVHEAAPYSLLEAMAARRPVIATAIGGNRELVDDGRTGLLVPTRDVPALSAALVSLAADPARARALGRAGLELQRRRYGVETMIDGYAAVLARCARGRRRLGSPRRFPRGTPEVPLGNARRRTAAATPAGREGQ